MRVGSHSQGKAYEAFYYQINKILSKRLCDLQLVAVSCLRRVSKQVAASEHKYY